jgi:hypothetical protein
MDIDYADMLGERDETYADGSPTPSHLATLLLRVIEYRNDEIREARSKAYLATTDLAKAQRELSLMTYERNEALQRIAKIYPILNKRQTAILMKPPVALKFGPPDLEFPVLDKETGTIRQVTVPQPAKMETVRRVGSHGGYPLKAVVEYKADRKSGGTS